MLRFSSSFAPIIALSIAAYAEQARPIVLPSWNEGPTKSVILDYIKNVTTPQSDKFVAEEHRIAVVRDDGVLTSESPSLQKAFLLISSKRLAKKDPSLLREEPFKSIEAKGALYVESLDDAKLREIGYLVRKKADKEFYRKLIQDFITTAKNPHLQILYRDLVYLPMKELLSYLRAVGFKVYIVSHGDVEFVKIISRKFYDIPPERVLNSDGYKRIMVDESTKTSAKEVKKATDAKGERDKPQTRKVLRKPILAVGRLKSGEDVDMLSNCQENARHTLQILILHDDAKREFRYGNDDRESFRAAKESGWLEVSMKKDWKVVFATKSISEIQTKPTSRAAQSSLEKVLATKNVPAEKPERGRQIGVSRPLEEKGPTKVQMAMFVTDIDEVNTASQNFTANVFISVRWWDPRLAHGAKGVLKYRLADVWTPRVLLMNEQKMWKTFDDIVEVSSSGEVKYVQSLWGNLSQPLDLRDFPFDEQALKFSFVTPGFTPEEIEFRPDETRAFGMAERFSVPDWDVVGSDVLTEPFAPYEGTELSALTFSLRIKRKSKYYIYRVILPLIFIVMMSWIVFWIDPEAVGTNISAATTSFLTLVAYRFAIGASIPKISYFTRLDAFIFFSTLLVFATLVNTIAVSYLFRMGKEHLTRRLDLIARFLYPILFTIVIVATLVL